MIENTIEGDTHEPESEMHAQEIKFPGAENSGAASGLADGDAGPALTPVAIRPNGVNILIQYEKPEKAGEIFLPNQAKGLEFIVAVVLEVGPDCKFVKKGDAVILAAKAIVNGERGVQIGVNRLHFTQENLIVAVVDGLLAKVGAPNGKKQG